MSRRQLLPKPTNIPVPQPDPSDESQTAHKRQGVSLACERCRKRKVKCDGGRPSCNPCFAANAECKFMSRGSSLAQRHEGLQESYKELRQAVETLCLGSERDAMDILKHVRQAQSLDNIIPVMCNHPRVVQYRLLSPEQRSSWVKAAQDGDLSECTSPPEPSNWTGQHHVLPVSCWTNLSQDDVWLSHLLRLFWTWDTTLARLFHYDLFVDVISTRQGNDDNFDDQFVAQFCSELLINSILAYSSRCFASSSHHTPKVHGQDFAREAYRLLGAKPLHNSISLLQAVAILSIYEYAFGDPQKGSMLFFGTLLDLRSTLNPVDERLVPDDARIRRRVQDALSLIASGFYCLDVKVCLITSPFVPPGWTTQLLTNGGQAPSPDVSTSDEKLWTPYPISDKPQISYRCDTFRIEYNLVRLTAECLEASEVNGKALMPNHHGAANIYNRLLNWKESNGRRFRGSSSTLPSWTAVLAFYHTACIKLLGPFVNLPFLEFPDGKSARILSLEHSESIISIIKEYDVVFSTRHDYWLLHTCETAVRRLLLETNLRGPAKDYLAKGCELLYSIGRYMPQANRILLDVKKYVLENDMAIPDTLKTTLQAGSTRATPTVIANAAYLVLEGDDAGMLPLGQLEFNEIIESI
ncbi:Zn(2)-C6 fungal-type DNA-binding domain protein [Metarhizium rileyi]|uniref:Zn(2)-C6 fungal-type DNA-binding domain protein n=1 Tax=Metarhizium rileyi (strain RCEF 4871) TaxID=1649241 RepID=A0A167BE21_METRR|nr:Zn(2)-C6 fungal-type DNA-binding domain protein [Metarhizium rileyi RCEF 4871]